MDTIEHSADEIITLYMNYVAKKNKTPKSIYSFCKKKGISESQFYNHFSSFEAIQEEIYKLFLINTITVLANNEEYDSFSTNDKLLSFYYTFFEMLTANRSYVKNDLGTNVKSIKKLKLLRQEFNKYISNLDMENIDLKNEQLNIFKDKSKNEFFWIQLLFTLNFWLNDTSKGFEKTDVLIEKSVNTTFEVMDTKPLLSLIDLGKFLFKEKMPAND